MPLVHQRVPTVAGTSTSIAYVWIYFITNGNLQCLTNRATQPLTTITNNGYTSSWRANGDCAIVTWRPCSDPALSSWNGLYRIDLWRGNHIFIIH